MHKLMDRYRDRRATEKDTHMADSSRYRDSEDDAGVGPGRGAPTGTPRWVKVSVAIVLVLVLVFVVLKVTGVGGEHGPGRHGAGGDTPPAIVREAGGGGGATSPAGVRDAGGAGGHRPPARGHTS